MPLLSSRASHLLNGKKREMFNFKTIAIELPLSSTWGEYNLGDAMMFSG